MTIPMKPVNISSDADSNRLSTLGNRLLIGIFAVLMFLQWSPPGFYTWLTSFRWYFMVGVAGFVFILQKFKINFQSIRFYLMFNVLSWAGILFALFRTPLFNQTLYSAVSMVIPFSLGLVLIPVFFQTRGRVIWLISLVVAALLWAYKIIQLWETLGEDIRHVLTGRGMDHNMISLCLSSAATALMVISLYGDFSIKQPLKKIIQLISFIVSIGFLVSSFLTYSRSGFIVTILGISFVVLTLILSKRLKTFFVIVAILLIGASLLIPLVQYTNPTWFIKFDELLRLSDQNTSVYTRTVLVQKAWQIIKENPIIGIGTGVFRTIYDPYIGDRSFYLPHNTYLGVWVGQGIFGLAGYLIWILLWINSIIKNWMKFDISTRALMSVFAPFFLMLAFLDLSGIVSIGMLAFFSGLNMRTEYA